MNPISRVNTADRLSAVISSTTVTSGCRSDESNPNASPDASQSAAPTSPASQFLQMSVDDAVAPIALYPDQLLAQILTASTNPQQVLDGGNWPLQNQSLKGDALTNAAMAASQRKRAQAQQTGNLTSSPQMTVSTQKADNEQQYIEMKNLCMLQPGAYELMPQCR